MSPVLTRPRPRSSPALLTREVLVLVLTGAIGIVALIAIHAEIRGPEFVDRVRVVNETPYLVDVEVNGSTRAGRLKLGPVTPGEAHDFGSVVDQGDEWIFHISTGPYDGGEFSVEKAELERGGWNVAIPDSVRARLEAQGAGPLARR